MKTKITLSTEQARYIANAIYKDIFEYVQNHKEEYENFLQNERDLDMQEEQQSQ